jgi:arylsulfatase
MQEVFAGFLSYTDEQIGRLLRFLEEAGLLAETLVMVVSDNGASAEGGALGSFNEFRFYNGFEESLEDNLAHLEELGSPLTHNHYPTGWAMAGNTPFRRYKSTVHYGGVRDPLILHWPARIGDHGGVRTQFHHAVDTYATLLDLVGVDAPEVYRGVPQLPVHGVSIAYTFDDPGAASRRRTQYFEMVGHRGLYHDGWKAVVHHERGLPFDDDRWELYEVAADWSECHDLAARYPERLRELVERWWVEAGRYNVLPLSDGFLAHVSRSLERRGGRQFRYERGVRIGGAARPDLRNRPYRIVAEVDIPQKGAEGVLFALGGRFAGQALFVQAGELVFDYNHTGTHFTVRSDRPVPSGGCRLEMRFRRLADNEGLATLLIDGAEVGSGPVRTLAVFDSCEPLDVGCDLGTPVSEAYESPYSFTGTLNSVAVEVGERGAIDVVAEFEAAVREQ